MPTMEAQRQRLKQKQKKIDLKSKSLIFIYTLIWNTFHIFMARSPLFVIFQMSFLKYEMVNFQWTHDF